MSLEGIRVPNVLLWMRSSVLSQIPSTLCAMIQAATTAATTAAAPAKPQHIFESFLFSAEESQERLRVSVRVVKREAGGGVQGVVVVVVESERVRWQCCRQLLYGANGRQILHFRVHGLGFRVQTCRVRASETQPAGNSVI